MTTTPSLVIPAVEAVNVPVAGGSLFPVRRIYCVGRNYVSHILEMKEADERDPPFFFQKPRDAIIGDGTSIAYPPDTADFQYEVELVAAVGLAGRNIDVASALQHIWGYAVGLDMTRRDRQRDARDLQLPWEPGKSLMSRRRAVSFIRLQPSAIPLPAPLPSPSTVSNISAATFTK